ncbi:U-box domain-containing protein 26-like protein [Cinnamomum micranthum f. kanehirae]|uniref:U-box domain-containing protein n=1 Tax=Cinnamomum micranthum f. kanehirae TaxID=337451 RepID=A0A3S3MS39_9MAGN|nr:U-box domain-containing protein 26-like protein [Cinnamomum micranthum f. kanehirae]
MSIPPLFRCPISLDLFTDPVTLSTGQTYERSSIEKWLADGNLTCPVTMQKLHDLTMVPNHTLRHLIDQWLLMDAQFDLEHIEWIDRDLSLGTLKNNLQSKDVTFATKMETLRKIKILSKESNTRRLCLIQLGFFPLLLQLIFGSHQVATKFCVEDTELIEEALSCLLNLSPCTQSASLNMLKEACSLASMVSLLDQGSMKIKISLCYLVEAISSSMDTKEISLVLGKNCTLLHLLISLLYQCSDQCASDAATRAVSSLCTWESNRDNIIKEGGIDGLIRYLSNPDRSCVSRALATIELLLELESGKKAVISNPNAVHALVKMVFRVCDHEGSESAVNSLLIMSYDSLRVREKAISEGIVTQLLLLLQSQSSSRVKAKARLLLKLLRSMWAENPSISSLQYGLVDS